MVRDGRSGKSLIGRNAADMEIVGYAGFTGIMDGMADAFLDAMRVGVPARMLPGQSMFGQRRNLSSVDVWNEKMGSLNAALSQAKREAQSAKDMAVESHADGDMEMAREYNKTASQRTADVVRLRRAVAAVAEERVVVEQTKPFDVRAEVWVPALRRLKTCQGSLSQAERVHFQMIFPKFMMELIDSTWWAVATMRLNTVEGVAELGPVRWPVSAQGRSTVLAMNRPVTTTGERRTRHEIVAVLVQSGRMCRDAAQTLTNAPFRELRYLVLHELCGEPLPVWVGPQWRDPVFVDWIVRTYTNLNWSWSGRGKYGSSLLNRQYAVCLVAKHGVMTSQDLRQHMGPSSMTASELYLPFMGKNTRQRAVQPCVVDAGLLEGKKRMLGPIVCECGMLATTVARSPEVLTDLLCDCGRAPGGEGLGMPAELRFPDDYQQMGMDLEQCQKLMAARRAKSGKNLTVREQVVMSRPDLFRTGISSGRLGRELNIMGLYATTESLRARGYIERFGTGTYPLWRLTKAGRAVIKELSSQ